MSSEQTFNPWDLSGYYRKRLFKSLLYALGVTALAVVFEASAYLRQADYPIIMFGVAAFPVYAWRQVAESFVVVRTGTYPLDLTGDREKQLRYLVTTQPMVLWSYACGLFVLANLSYVGWTYLSPDLLAYKYVLAVVAATLAESHVYQKGPASFDPQDLEIFREKLFSSLIFVAVFSFLAYSALSYWQLLLELL